MKTRGRGDTNSRSRHCSLSSRGLRSSKSSEGLVRGTGGRVLLVSPIPLLPFTAENQGVHVGEVLGHIVTRPSTTNSTPLLESAGSSTAQVASLMEVQVWHALAALPTLPTRTLPLGRAGFHTVFSTHNYGIISEKSTAKEERHKKHNKHNGTALHNVYLIQ